jgi:hypothetical protein
MFDVPDAPWIGKGREVERKVAFTCTCCGEDILDGDDYLEVMGDPFCEDCVKLRTAEYEGD